MVELKKRIKNITKESKIAFAFLLCGIMQKGISVIVTPIFTRIMSVEEYGLYSNYNAWYQIIYIFITLKISSGAYTQGLIKYEDDKDNFQASMLELTILSFVVAGGMVLLCPSKWSELLNIPAIFIFSILIDSVVDAFYQLWVKRKIVDQKCIGVIVVTLVNAFVTPILGIIAILHTTYKVEARVFTSVLMDVILFLPLGYLQLRRAKKHLCFKYWKHGLVMAIPLIPHYLSSIILNQSDRIMIKNICGDGAAGIYSLGYSIAFMLQIVCEALNRSIDPWLMRKLKRRDCDSVGKTTYLLLILVGIANVLLIIIAPEVIKIFAPSEYYDAMWIIPPVATSVFVNFLYNFFADVEFYYEKTYFVSIASFVAAGLNLLLNKLLIPQYGFIIAGYTTLISYIVFVAMHYMFMNMICKKQLNGKKIYNIKIIVFIICIFVCCSGLFMLLYNNVILRYVLFLFICVGMFLARKKIINTIKSMTE